MAQFGREFPRPAILNESTDSKTEPREKSGMEGKSSTTLSAEAEELIAAIEPLAEKAEAGPLSFADVNRLHALVLDLAIELRKCRKQGRV